MARPAVPLAISKRESPYVDAQRPESSTRMGRGGRRVTRVAGIDGRTASLYYKQTSHAQ